MAILRKYRNYVLAVIYPAVIFLFLNSAINGHYHRLADGKIIYHAHPFNKKAESSVPFNSNHHHSKLQLTIISLVTKVFYSGILSFLLLVAITLPFIILIKQAVDKVFYSAFLLPISSRGPPRSYFLSVY